MKKEKVKINVKDRLEDNVLDLSLSEIELIPVKEIASLRRATVLDLSSNNIKYLPKNFGTQLSNFHRIDLSKNYLKFLPEDFGALSNLKHLDLFNNQLENLPLSFGKLTKLKYLDLKGNPLTPALEKIVGQCLTVKECQDAAKNVVPYYADMAKKFENEQRKKAEKEAKEKELAALKEREERRLAKKAARKERVMLERQQREESEKLLVNNVETAQHSNDVRKDFPEKSVENSVKLLKFVKTCLLISILFILLFALFLKYVPVERNWFIPLQYKELFNHIFKKLEELILESADKLEKYFNTED